MSDQAIIGQVIIFILAILVILVGVQGFPPEPIPEPTRTIMPESIIPTIIITPTHTIPPEPTPENRVAMVRVTSVNVHSLPGVNEPVFTWVNWGRIVIVQACQDGWARILTDDIVGWVNGTCLKPNPCGEDGSCN